MQFLNIAILLTAIASAPTAATESTREGVNAPRYWHSWLAPSLGYAGIGRGGLSAGARVALFSPDYYGGSLGAGYTTARFAHSVRDEVGITALLGKGFRIGDLLLLLNTGIGHSYRSSSPSGDAFYRRPMWVVVPFDLTVQWPRWKHLAVGLNGFYQVPVFGAVAPEYQYGGIRLELPLGRVNPASQSR